MSRFVFAVLSLASFALASSAGTVTLNVVGGQLVGASNVDVGGSLFDVAFEDGTCPALYPNSCTTFVFSTEADATAASQALLDQVFTGTYDLFPDLTNGCSELDQCSALTAYGLSGIDLLVVAATNGDGSTVFDQVSSTTLNGLYDSNTDTGSILAVWTAVSVPEPGGPALLALGLVAMGAARRRSG